MRNTIWNAARKMTLGVAVVAGLFTVGTVSAKAAPIQFSVSFGDRYNCPGEGYVWTDGYYNGGYWVPGQWVFRGGGYRPAYGYGYRNDFRYERDRRYEYRDRDHDRGWDRGHDRDWDRHDDRDHHGRR